jgi:zinc protease
LLAVEFEPARAKALLRKYFGSLRPGAPVPPVALPSEAADVAITTERRVVVPDRVELPRLTLAWHSAAAYAPGDAELQLAAGVLGGDKSSRLYRKLVYERQIAQSVTASQYGQALGSVFSIEVVARPGHTLDEIQGVVDEELAALAATPPAEAELQRARRAVETQLFGRLETVGGIADLLNEYNQLAGDIDYLPKDLARFRAVTPEALRQAVARTLPRSTRVAVLAQPGEQVLPAEVPTPPLPEAARRAGQGVAINADEPWRRRGPAPGPARPLVLPAGDRFELANGLTVVRVARAGVPLVSAALVLRAGQDANPSDRPGLAGFTAALLEDGTESRSATAFAEQVADLGATLTAKAGREDARIEFAGLRSGLPEGLDLVADAARHPAFDPAEIERRRAARHAALLQQREDARAHGGHGGAAGLVRRGPPARRQPARRRGGARGHHARRPAGLLALALPARPGRAGGGRRRRRRGAAHAGRAAVR